MGASEYDFAEAEKLTREELDALQLERLQWTLHQAAKAPFYQQRFEALGGVPQVTSLEGLRKLPVTTKDDLRAGMPWGFLAVPRREAVRMHYSSGTTGVATAVYHTAGDVRRWAECVARGMLAAGVSADDVFQNMMTYGLFTGGLGFHYAAELIGCLTIPVGGGNTARQVHIMHTFGTTCLHILPSYALRVALFCQEQGLDPRDDLAVRVLFIGGEPHTENSRRRIESQFAGKAYNCYGLSELCGPGVAMECEEQTGLHLREDHYIAEILDPDTLEPVPEGEYGELVVTTLTREAMPLIRYRTRDITRFLPGECACGRAHRRIDRIRGRSDDMLIVRGCNVYPMQVERILMGYTELGSNWLITLDRVRGMDRMTVTVELSPDYGVDEARQLEALRERIQHDLRTELLLTPEVELAEPGKLPVSEGKAQRVIDKRQEE
ncbi:MAG: phenylacetate--CoA ligase [Armatimonadetes bacterium]|nr:phenylacetate--CoA ligase [Armatimonadota bacterium]